MDLNVEDLSGFASCRERQSREAQRSTCGEKHVRHEALKRHGSEAEMSMRFGTGIRSSIKSELMAKGRRLFGQKSKQIKSLTYFNHDPRPSSHSRAR